jgi:amino acid permease
VLYAILTSLFMCFLIVLGVLAGKLFHDERYDSLKEGAKYLVKFFSIMMTAFLFIMQIPMITIYM